MDPHTPSISLKEGHRPPEAAFEPSPGIGNAIKVKIPCSGLHSCPSRLVCERCKARQIRIPAFTIRSASVSFGHSFGHAFIRSASDVSITPSAAAVSINRLGLCHFTSLSTVKSRTVSNNKSISSGVCSVRLMPLLRPSPAAARLHIADI